MTGEAAAPESRSLVSSPRVKLSAAQERALQEILSAPRDCMLLGGAGTGKSTILMALAEQVPLARTATTGIAAINFGGSTVDTLMGFSREDWKVKNLDTTFKRMMKCPERIAIDETSMVGDKMAQIIHWVAREFRKKLILVGDFAQASPVKDDLAISSPLFTNARHIHLTEYFRQGAGPFLEALRQLRTGELDGPATQLFRDRVQGAPDGEVIRGYGTNGTAGRYNTQRLAQLPGAPLSLTATHRDKRPPATVERYPLYESTVRTRLETCRLANGLEVRVGARVLLTRNVYDQEEGQDPQVRFVNGDTGTILAALSLDGKPARPAPVLDFSNAFLAAPPAAPVFPGGEVHSLEVLLDRTGEVVSVLEVEHEVTDPLDTKVVVATVTGFPVMLGWACTVHKLQGMTLHRLHVDVESILYHPQASRHGLAYVAFSRVRTPEGLTLSGWDPGAIYCDPRIKHLL